MSDITMEELNNYRLFFISEKEKILAAFNQSIELDVDGDDVDKVQGQILGNLVQRLGSLQQRKIRAINLALKRIEDGTFGECEECGELIASKRLEAKPDANTCISCAERLERVSKQYGR